VIDASLQSRAAVHAALGDPLRLAIVDELVVADRTASELRLLFGIESNLAAHHIRVLEEAGLLERTVSDGDRRRRYLRLRRTDVDVGRPEAIGVGGVVFVCTHNSARSHLAAALWNRTSPVRATSAGTHPADAVHPRAVVAADAVGLDLHGAVPTRFDPAEVDGLVITVCDRAHEEFRNTGFRELHWSVPDPARDGRQPAFHAAVAAIAERVDTVVPLVAAP